MKFQDKFYDIIDHNKCPSIEKSAAKCILRNSYFHHSEPIHNAIVVEIRSIVMQACLTDDSVDQQSRKEG